jgi:CRISP-associated protein Cas1
LLVIQETGEAQIPFEDVETIIIDSPQVSLTAPVLRAVADHGAVLIVCDEKHLPAGMYLPQYQHFKSGPLVALQLTAKVPFTKRIWQAIVKAKLRNQQEILRQKKLIKINKFDSLIAKVMSGDSTNVEAQAAKIYWPILLGSFFRRGDDKNEMNKALNYGYAILRSALARAVVARGLLPLIGIHHKNMLNAFCLVDDLIEPFRPFVDQAVSEYFEQESATFDVHCRHILIAILYNQVIFAGEQMTLSVSLIDHVSSFVRCLKAGKTDMLDFPIFLQV